MLCHVGERSQHSGIIDAKGTGVKDRMSIEKVIVGAFVSGELVGIWVQGERHNPFVVHLSQLTAQSLGKMQYGGARQVLVDVIFICGPWGVEIGR